MHHQSGMSHTTSYFNTTLYCSQRRRKQILKGQLESNELIIMCVISSGQLWAALLNCLNISIFGLQYTAHTGNRILTSFHQVKCLVFLNCWFLQGIVGIAQGKPASLQLLLSVWALVGVSWRTKTVPEWKHIAICIR